MMQINNVREVGTVCLPQNLLYRSGGLRGCLGALSMLARVSAGLGMVKKCKYFWRRMRMTKDTLVMMQLVK